MLKITTTPIEKDERSPLKQISGLNVNYQNTINGILYEIDFIYDENKDTIEPISFSDTESENYFNNNYDEIYSSIVNQIY